MSHETARRSPGGRAQVFRPAWFLPVSTGCAGVIWLATLVYLLRFSGVPPKTFLSTVFFVAFFAVSFFYHLRTAFYVDASGVTCRGMTRTRRLEYAEIRKLDVLPGPVTVYAVRGPRGRAVHFTSFIRHHRRLFALLIERSGLSPRP